MFKGKAFDINKDGKTSFGEQWAAYKTYEAWQKAKAKEEAEYDSDYSEWDYDDDSDKYEWRLYCDDGAEFDIDPEDYETEEEYEEALEEAREALEKEREELEGTSEEWEATKYAWRDEYEYDYDTGLDPDDYETEDEYLEYVELYEDMEELNFYGEIEEEIKESDYPNKRRYYAALTLEDESTCIDEYEAKQRKRSKFIIEKADTVIAANYLTPYGNFLYAQAIKEYFQLPITLPDEDITRETEFSKILQEIANKNILLCFKVWSWCQEQFLDYEKYDEEAKDTLTTDVLGYYYYFPNQFGSELVKYMEKYPKFRARVIREGEQIVPNLDALIVKAFENGMVDMVKSIFEDGLYAANGNVEAILRLTKCVIHFVEHCNEMELIEYAECELLPLVKDYQDEKVFDEIEEWKEVTEKSKHRISWSWKQYGDTRSQRENVNHHKNEVTYIYCSVILPFSYRTYSYRTDDASIKIGDTVIVPVGKEAEEMMGTVVEVGKYYENEVPYPVKKTKMIIRKVTI